MNTLEKIRKLDDNELITVYKGFSKKFTNDLNIDFLEVLKNPPDEVGQDETFQKIDTSNPDNLDEPVVPDEVIPAVRIIVENWAAHPELAPELEDFLKKPMETTMDAGTILAIGSVLFMTIVSSSIKV